MFALDLYETARDMWTSIRSQDVMELPEETNLTELHQFLRDIVREGGMDVTPLEEIVERVLDEDALRASPIRFGLVTVEKRGLKPRELPLEEIPQGKVKDYLLASAACFPALRAKQIDGVQFLDGGYRDNMPTALAQKMGAEELVCVDLEGVGITLPNRTGLPTTMVRSYWELGDILHFDPDTAKRNIELGYYDTLRAFGRLRGCAYAIAKSGASDRQGEVPGHSDGRPRPPAGQHERCRDRPAGSCRRGRGGGPRPLLHGGAARQSLSGTMRPQPHREFCAPV